MTAPLRRLRTRSSGRTRIIAGWAALAVTAATVVVLPPSWLAIVLAAAAVAGLAGDARLGWMPAALLVILALPFGLSADSTPVTVSGWPVRPQDVAIAVGVVGALLAARSDRVGWTRIGVGGRTLVVAIGIFTVVGIAAAIEGGLAGHATRDILRDARWWVFYLAAPLALLAGAPAANVLRALLLGMAVFAGVVVATMVLPAFSGGLKAATLAFYSGTLRMQFGNSIFLVPTLAWATRRMLTHRAATPLAAVAVLFAAIMVSLTRMTILVSIGVVLGVVLLHAWSELGQRRWSIRWGRGRRHDAMAVAALGLAIVFAGAGAVGLSTYAAATAGDARSDPLRRLIFDEEGSDIDAILESGVSGGRLATYVSALDLIQESPVVGRGMGQLVRVRFASTTARAHTRGQQPGVDNAYLTVGMKAGAVGIAAFSAMVLLPLIASLRDRRRAAIWYVPAWLGIGALSLTQSFATSGYSPFGIALLAVLPFLARARLDRH